MEKEKEEGRSSLQEEGYKSLVDIRESSLRSVVNEEEGEGELRSFKDRSRELWIN